MAAFLKLKSSPLKLKPLLLHRRCCHFFDELGPKLKDSSGDVADTKKWKKLDSRSLGITSSAISHASRTVVRLLQNEGYDTFLVGGCVRDLILNKIPKDFDVITTANLQQVKKKFYRALIVGRRFPICLVRVGGCEIEVSSFETVADHSKGLEGHLSKLPKGYDDKDVVRWRNSLLRDFTVNSLFYDPFAHKIYDYSNGMADLKAMKLRTLIPAHMSFQLDCARILRGLRIAARLGFSFSKDTEKAVHNLHDSIKTLSKARLMMEMNYMLSYGAAQSSLLLLKRFNLLEIIFPFQAAYLAELSNGQTPVMLMKLFSNLDSVVSCDQPCDSSLWVSMLVFHLALVNNPQDALVVWTLSSLLWHGTWEEGVKAAREHSKEHVNFAPEIINSYDDVADEELAQKVSKFVSIILDSIGALTDSSTLHTVMLRYSSAPCADVVISHNAGRAVADIFYFLVNDIKSLNLKKHTYEIDYELLRKGDISETRFVLGKVIMGTMRDGITQCRTKLLSEKKDKFHSLKQKLELEDHGKPNSKVVKQEMQNKKGKEKRKSAGNEGQRLRQTAKKQKLVEEKLGEILGSRGVAKRKNQVKEVVEKDVKTLLSTYTEKSQQDTKLEICQHSEGQMSNEMPGILEKKPTMMKYQTLAPSGILYVLGDLSPQDTQLKIHQHSEAQTPNEIPTILKIHQQDTKLKIHQHSEALTPKEIPTILKKVSTPLKQNQTQLDTKLKIHQHSEAQTPQEIPTILEIHQQDTKLKIHQHYEAQTPKEMPTILKKITKPSKQNQTPATNQILHVLENATKMGEQHDAQTPKETSSKPKALKQRKSQAPIEMLNVLKVSNHLREDENNSKHYSKPEKQPTVEVEEQGQGAFENMKKTRKLSSFFK